MRSATLVLVARLLLVTFCLVAGNYPASAQLPAQVSAVQDHLRALGQQLESSTRETELFLSEKRVREGQCANLYEPFSPNMRLLSSDSFLEYAGLREQFDRLSHTLQPILDVEREVEARRADLRQIDNRLAEMKLTVANLDANVANQNVTIAGWIRLPGKRKGT